MTTTIYLIRHGQTDWNKQQIFRGRKDIPLNERGREEALALSKHLAAVKFSAGYASPLSRSFETAEIVARPHGLTVQLDEGMVDINYGVWEGLSDDEVKKRFAILYRRWHSEPQRVRFPGGESLLMVKKRALTSLEGFRNRHPGETVFVVSHRAVTKVVMCAMLGLTNRSFWKIFQDNCAFNIIMLSKDDAYVSALNDTCHMRAAGIAPSLPDF
jgi:broad specificity phosphatase PhoE